MELYDNMKKPKAYVDNLYLCCGKQDTPGQTRIYSKPNFKQLHCIKTKWKIMII